MAGAVNHDRVKHAPHVDIAWDLDKMPWEVGSGYEIVYAFDVLEHLRDTYGAINEIHNILVPHGALVVRMPAWDNPISYGDLTHRVVVMENSLDFFDRSRVRGKAFSPYHPVDTMGRLPSTWKIVSVERVNPDSRWPDRGDWQWVMEAL
jgi:trans-aconitate methyltransferase